MRRYISAGIFCLSIVFGIIFTATHSYIDVTVVGAPSSSNTTVSFTHSGKSIDTVNTKSTHFKQLVRSGDYQVYATSSNGGFFVSVHASRFLTSKKIHGTLRPESSRTFLGDNPGSCMYYLGKQLVSGECNDSVNLLQQHIPATAASPTYVLPLPTLKLEASSKGMVTTPTESVMLAQSEGDFSEYFLQQINPDFTTGIRRNIPGDGSRGLQIAGYKQGFILYDKSLATFDYYQNINSSPQRILLEKPTNTKLTRYKASVHDDAITVLSANIPVGDQGLNPNSDPTEIQKIDGGLSEVVMFRDGKQKHFTFNLSFRSVDACGTNKLCAIDNSGLAVYDLATKKPKVLYRIDGATDIHTVASSVQVVTSSGVITLNPDTGNGHYSYSYGGYSNCGIFTTAPHGYVLCIANKKGSRAALYVDVSKNNSDSIDKKILKLSEAQNVKSVSVTQDTIYVVPDYGELVYNPETNLNTHDPATVKSIDRSIDSAIQKSEIDRKIYMIQNLGKID